MTPKYANNNRKFIEDNDKDERQATFYTVAFTTKVLAQQATLDIYAPQGFVYQNGNDAFLPFTIHLNNPTSSSISDVSFSISMPDDVDLDSVDGECTDTSDGTTRTLTCTIDELDVNSGELLDFIIHGPGSVDAGPSFTLNLSALNVTVIEPNGLSLGIADGDRTVRGSSITVDVVRNINYDQDQNNVPDLDEAIINNSSATAEQLLATGAVVDVLFIHSSEATAYLDGKLEDKIAQLLTATNQIYRDSGVGIEFNAVGLEEVLYSGASNTIDEALAALDTQSDPSFFSVNNMITGSGGDLVVFLHALDAGAAGSCVSYSTNGIARQGDFQREYHQGELITAVNLGPDCLATTNLAAAFAANMGIVASRLDSPDGGTFSYSAGYGIEDEFTTVMAREGNQNFGTAKSINVFSNSEGFCESLTCGTDRGDLIDGADAVHSMNRSRHVVSALSDSVFPATAEEIPDKTTILDDTDSGITLRVLAAEGAALLNNYAQMVLQVENTSASTMSNLNISLLNLNDGLVSFETQSYQHTAELCAVFGDDLATAGSVSDGMIEKAGSLNCFVSDIAAGDTISISYGVLVDDTPPVLNGSNYYHQMAAVNGIVDYYSQGCVPVFANFVAAAAGSLVCDDVVDFLVIPDTGEGADLAAVPTVTGSQISVPFIRIDDGSLISAEFTISNFSPLELRLDSYVTLDSSLAPTVEGTFDVEGQLILNELEVDTITYQVTASYVADSSPALFSDLVIVQTAP